MSAGEPIDLRRRAQERLSHERLEAPPLAPDVLAAELEIQRVELDMQRDEIEQQRDDARAARNRYAALCDLAPAGLLVIDSYSRVLDANATAWQLLGSYNQYVHETELLLYLEWPDATRLRTALGRGAATTMELQVRPRRGKPFRALFSLAPIEGNDQAFHLAIIDLTQHAIRAPQTIVVCEPDVAGPSILVIEPYLPGRRALRDTLDELGYAIVDAEDAADALRIATTAPQLVIADYQPGHPELIDALRAHWPGIPAVLLCANREVVRDIPAGAILLPKPLAFEALERAIAALLPRR